MDTVYFRGALPSGPANPGPGRRCPPHVPINPARPPATRVGCRGWCAGIVSSRPFIPYVVSSRPAEKVTAVRKKRICRVACLRGHQGRRPSPGWRCSHVRRLQATWRPSWNIATQGQLGEAPPLADWFLSRAPVGYASSNFRAHYHPGNPIRSHRPGHCCHCDALTSPFTANAKSRPHPPNGTRQSRGRQVTLARLSRCRGIPKQDVAGPPLR